MQQLPLTLRRFVWILLGCWVLVAWIAGTATAQGTRIWLDPETLDLVPGDVGTLDVRVEDVDQLAGSEVHLTFDPALLEVVDADPAVEGIQIAHGDFLSPDFIVQNIVDLDTGTVDYAIACVPLDRAVSGSGVLARITVRALAEGETLVTISGALLADKEMQPIPVETTSSVVVIGNPRASLTVWILIGLVAVAVAAGIVVVAWNTFKVH